MCTVYWDVLSSAGCAQCTVYGVQFTVYSVHCTEYTVQCTTLSHVESFIESEVPPENFPSEKYDAPEEVDGKRKSFDSPSRK